MESANVNGGLTANSKSSLETRVTLIITIFVISFFILAGNLFTVVNIFCFIKRRNTSSFLLITISLIDILNILGPNIVSFFVFFDKESNFHNHFTLCRIQAWAIVFLRCASALTISLLSLDRVFITLTPRFYRKKWKGKLFAAFCFGKWIVSAFIATWPLFWLDAFQISKDTRDTLCLFLYENPFAGFFVVFLLCSMLVCCLCFYVIFSTSNKKSFSTEAAKEEEFSYNTKQVSLVNSTEEKDLNILTSVLFGVYFCCIIPWMVREKQIFHPRLRLIFSSSFQLLDCKFCCRRCGKTCMQSNGWIENFHRSILVLRAKNVKSNIYVTVQLGLLVRIFGER